ncbi:MAG: hypothetical protein AABZ17_10105 [Nitrospirota bacterium]
MKEQQADEALRTETKKRQAQTVSQFAEKFGADLTWVKQMKGDTVTTFQLQKALILSGGKPVLVLGNVLDIEQRDGRFMLLFHVSGTSDSILTERVLVFELTCSLPESQVNSLRIEEFYPWDDPKYIVAARIHSVAQAHQFLLTHDRESSGSLEKILIEHVAKGECIGLESVAAEGGPTSRITKPSGGSARIGKD